VVARWRNDVEYVAAGIYCFQPYCVTGELPPPANPLICPQFCVRFNDLDNIGLTGRHYSGFVMLGLQVFNYPNEYVFFKDECVEFNYRWLTEELQIDADDITFVEDIWAGGGNMGPSVEYFIGGLEVGNMVFINYKYFPDGSYEELPVRVIDVGIGLERIPWLINGTATSYLDVFTESLAYLQDKLKIEINHDIWSKMGPYSSILNIDEVDDIEATWLNISTLIGIDVASIKTAIQPVKDLYIVLDHTRTVLMVVNDGSLPSNVGGGSNVRNILRRVFAILKKNNWWELLTLKGLLELFQSHKKDLS
jgi:alanyl-tRNA synthetase